MKRALFLCTFFFALPGLSAFAQNARLDSTKAATTLSKLLSVCKNIDFTDPKTQSLGTFYKAAPYIIYRGEKDKARRWKDFAKYNNEEEKKGVDEICLKINGGVNQDPNWKIIKYSTEKESEGTWHVLIVSYVRKGVAKQTAFAFLKIKSQFGLGDID